MSTISRFPRHAAPVLHDNAVLMSYENCFKLGKIYKEVIGIKNIHHFSLNVVDLDGKMSILSYNPQIAFNIFKDGSYLYNGSISASYYNTREIYSWDETYDPSFYDLLKHNMERKNGIAKGIVLVKKVNGLTLLYSFATKLNPIDFTNEISENKSFFYNIGDHCFDLISPILQSHEIGAPIQKKENRVLNSNVIEFKRHG